MATETESPSSAQLPRLETFEEFVEWYDEEVRAEWVDGEVILMSPATPDHQRIVGFLLRYLSQFVELQGLGEIFTAPVLMRLANRPSGREPDILFVAKEHVDQVRPTYVEGPADLVIEVVSPESDTRDRGEKFVEYEAAGIPEYWLIDLLRRQAFFFQLGPDGRYQPALTGSEGTYRSRILPGLALQVEWLWRRPLPSLAEITTPS